MRKLRRILLVLIASGLIISLTMVLPAGATSSSSGKTQVLNSELVFCETNSIGNVVNMQVINQLTVSGDGTVSVTAKKDLPGNTTYQGIYGFSTPKVEGDQIVWGEVAAHGDVTNVAQTNLSDEMVNAAKSKLPVDLHYNYTLDGKKVTPEEITGKSGHFKMELTITNKSKERTTVQVKDPDTGQMKTTQVDTYLPVVIQPYNWNFDNKVFQNIKCDETGIIFYTPTYAQIGWTIPLFPPATPEADTIFVEADVTNFRMPTLTLPIACVFPKTNQIDTMSAFHSGFEQLYGGVKQMDQGLGDTSNSQSLLYAIDQVNNGLEKMADAATGLPYAKANLDSLLIPGVEEAAAGIGSTSTTNTLLWLMSQLQAGFLGIQSGINDMLAGMGDASNPATIIGGVTAIGNLLQLWSGELQTAITDLGSVADDLKAGGTTYDYVSANVADPVRQNILDYLTADATTIGNQAANLGTMKGLMDYVISQLPTMNTGLSDMKSGMQTIVGIIGAASTPNTLLYAVDQGIVGLKQLKAGLSSGSTANPGIKEGLQLLSSGLGDAISGLGSATTENSLIYGTTAIKGGLDQMKSGTSQMASGLLDTLVTLNSSDAQLAAIAKRGEEFDHLLGKAEGDNVDNEVRFMYQNHATYSYTEGNSWVTALILALVLIVVLIAGGILLVRRRMSA
jgi:putative membrane protein